MRNFATLPLAHLQATQPWTVPYSSDFIAALERTPHIVGTHAVLHAQKTVGQIAAVFEQLDHSGLNISQAQVQALADKSADLVTAAMRFANLYGFDLTRAVVERSEEKNSVTLPYWEA